MADAGLGEIIEEAGKQVDAESQETEPEVKEESSTSEETSPEEKELEADEEYSNLKKGIDDDIGSQKNIHPRFREIYKKLKDSQRNSEELQKQLDESSTKPEVPEISEGDLLKYAKDQGYQLTKAEEKEVKDSLQDMLNGVGKPEDRQWLTKFANAIKKEATGKHEEEMSEVRRFMTQAKLKNSEADARELIKSVNEKHGLKMDFAKDVDPELQKMLKANPNLNHTNTDIYQLTKEFLAVKGIELGKQLSEKAQRELNEKKKSANTETQGVTSTTKVDDSKSTFADIMQDVAKKEGASHFS